MIRSEYTPIDSWEDWLSWTKSYSIYASISTFSQNLICFDKLSIELLMFVGKGVGGAYSIPASLMSGISDYELLSIRFMELVDGQTIIPALHNVLKIFDWSNDMTNFIIKVNPDMLRTIINDLDRANKLAAFL